MRLNRKRIDEMAGRRLMLVTAQPGHRLRQASAIAQAANDQNLRLREVALASGATDASPLR
ncbi:MAG TPA: hypothetical protein VMA54_21895 [Steroidobacteraceae bacterium]|nr:hypothetical protein [Steroidobacteraceae bacterium]